jgi:hypothetical protein
MPWLRAGAASERIAVRALPLIAVSPTCAVGLAKVIKLLGKSASSIALKVIPPGEEVETANCLATVDGHE